MSGRTVAHEISSAGWGIWPRAGDRHIKRRLLLCFEPAKSCVLFLPMVKVGCSDLYHTGRAEPRISYHSLHSPPRFSRTSRTQDRTKSLLQTGASNIQFYDLKLWLGDGDCGKVRNKADLYKQKNIFNVT